jgi:hypothetical protein
MSYLSLSLSLCCSTVGDSPDAMSKLTEEDLKFLFQI